MPSERVPPSPLQAEPQTPPPPQKPQLSAKPEPSGEPASAPTVRVQVCLSIVRPPQIRFVANSAAITPELAKTLDEIARLIKTHNLKRIQINGHVSLGEATHLGLQRAEAVHVGLEQRGVDPSRLCVRNRANTPARR